MSEKLFGTPEEVADQVGLTGRYPEGKICEGDLGSVMIALAVDHVRRTVWINMGREFGYVGMTKASALAFAEKIKNKANELPD